MIERAEIQLIVRNHQNWVSQNRNEWDRYRAAFKDKFWEKATYGRTRGRIEDRDVGPVKVETNQVKSWVNSFVAGLFYKGMRTTFSVDPVVYGKAPNLEDYEPGDPALACSIVADRFLNEQYADILTDQAFSMALMYPEIGFKLGEDDRLGDSPFDKIWLECIPPWELVMDRRAQNPRFMRYIGHTYYMPIEEFRALYGDVDGVNPIIRPDVLEDGFYTSDAWEGVPAFVRILEWYDLTETFEASDGSNARGIMRVYAIDESSGDAVGVTQVSDDEAIPYSWADGTPAPPIFPVVLENVPEFPMEGISSVGSIYQITRERNFITTWLANAFRRDAARVLLMRKDALDGESLDEIMSGRDGVVAEIEFEGELGQVARWLDQQPVSKTIFDYLGVLGQNQAETQGIADFTRGKALNYATATEVHTLSQYTETTLGKLRKRMDRALSRLVRLYMRVLYESLGRKGTFSVRVHGEVREFDVELLGANWAVSLSDIANTPIAEAQRRQEFISIHTQLMELVTVATSQEVTPQAKRMAELQLNYLVELYNLPDDFTWDTLSQLGPDEEVLSDEELGDLLADEDVKAAARQAVAQIDRVPSPELPDEVLSERQEIINAPN